MAITITLPTPMSKVGPGIPIQITSSFIGPLPTGSQWVTELAIDSEFAEIGYSHFTPNPHPPLVTIYPYRHTVTGDFWSTTTNFAWDDGQTVYIRGSLQEPPATTVDSGTATSTYSSTDGLQNILQDIVASVPAGLGATVNAIKVDTDNINAQMSIPVTTPAGTSNVNLRDLFAQHTLDALTLDNLTPVPTGGPVTADVSDGWIFGVIVRLTTIPYPYTPHTPDGDYYLESLAVLTIFRGTDKRLRVPIHTSNHMESPLPGYAIGGISDFTLGTLPPWSSIEVDFAAGVFGQVYLMKLP